MGTHDRVWSPAGLTPFPAPRPFQGNYDPLSLLYSPNPDILAYRDYWLCVIVFHNLVVWEVKMLLFIIGLFVGVWVGIGFMCLMLMAAKADEHIERMNHEMPKV